MYLSKYTFVRSAMRCNRSSIWVSFEVVIVKIIPKNGSLNEVLVFRHFLIVCGADQQSVEVEPADASRRAMTRPCRIGYDARDPSVSEREQRRGDSCLNGKGNEGVFPRHPRPRPYSKDVAAETIGDWVMCRIPDSNLSSCFSRTSLAEGHCATAPCPTHKVS